MNNKSCRNCKWHDDFSWVCFNGHSPYRGDFINADFLCDYYELTKDHNYDAGGD